MDAALEHEKNAQRSSAQGTRITLPTGQHHGVDGAFHQYLFRLDASGRLYPNQEVQLLVDSRALSCTVVRTGSSELVLALPRRMGSEIRAGSVLVVDTVWMIDALQRRLNDCFSGPTAGTHKTPFNLQAAHRIIGQGNYSHALALPSGDAHLNGAALNDEQAHALKLAFRRNACYIIGPPGTGKTLTLARVVEAHARAGRSVLVVGPSNRSVDILMRAVAERLRDHPDYDRGLIIRFGPRPTTRVLGRFSTDICHGPVVDRIRRERHEAASARLGVLHARASLAVEALEATEAACRSCTGPYPASSYREALQRRHRRAVTRLCWVLRHQDRLQEASLLLPPRLIERCRVLGTTIHQTYLSRALLREYDVVVIDEASMVQTVQAFVVASLAESKRGRIIVAGDYRQIPPVVEATTREAQRWLATDVFHSAGIPDDLARDDDVPYAACLNVQYRMSPGICSVVSNSFYEGRLKTDRSVRGRPSLPCPFGRSDVYLIDSSPMAPSVRPSLGHSRVNQKHVAIVEALLAELNSGGAIPKGGRRNVAVITPFRDQAMAIRACLGTQYRNRGVVVTTAHSSQGGEAEIVVLDLTDAPGMPVSMFLHAVELWRSGPRVLNVAMSRARQQLYIIGALEYLERAGGRVVQQLIRNLRIEAQGIPLAQIVGTGAARGAVGSQARASTCSSQLGNGLGKSRR
jgi:hypothetical protein